MNYMYFWLIICFVSVSIYQSFDLQQEIKRCQSEEPLSQYAKENCWNLNSTWIQQDINIDNVKNDIIEQSMKYLNKLNESEKQNPETVLIYIHAYIPKEKVMAGYLILDKILDRIRFSGLLYRATKIYLICYDERGPIFYLTHQYYTNPRNNNLIVVTELMKYYKYNEFPTLLFLQTQARYLHPQSKLLYLHSKGVTKFSDKGRAVLRDCMSYFCINLFDQSLQLLRQGWLTAGIHYMDDPWPHYSGNFFWLQAQAASNNTDVREINWYWRYGAERWALSHLSKPCKIFRFGLYFNEIVQDVIEKYHLHNIPSPRC